MNKVLVLVELKFSDDVIAISYEDILEALNTFAETDDQIIMYKRVK